MPTFRLDERRALEAARLEQQQARILRDIVLDQPLEHTIRTDAVPDPQDLRGIPAIGRGVTGTSPGTDPEREACR